MKDIPSIQTGRRVLFVGGPEAGNVRAIPNSAGDFVKSSDGEYVYKIWPFKVGKDELFIAWRQGDHILNAIVEMFREYAPAAQIKRQAGIETYQDIGRNNQPRST